MGTSAHPGQKGREKDAHQYGNAGTNLRNAGLWHYGCDVYLSTVTLREVEKCSEPKRTQLIDCLNEIPFTTLDITEDVTRVAKKMIEMGILTQKSFDDCQHIGAAVINECDCIISWNFKHIVNVKTIRGVRAITNLEGYKMIEIWNPSVLLESEE